jgi:hypothetical protein
MLRLLIIVYLKYGDRKTTNDILFTPSFVKIVEAYVISYRSDLYLQVGGEEISIKIELFNGCKTLGVHVFTTVNLMGCDTFLSCRWRLPFRRFRLELKLDVAYSSDMLVDAYKTTRCQIHKIIIVITKLHMRSDMLLEESLR